MQRPSSTRIHIEDGYAHPPCASETIVRLLTQNIIHFTLYHVHAQYRLFTVFNIFVFLGAVLVRREVSVSR
jgi:hypothetical protein